MTATVPNGTYFLHPEGSCWIAVRYRNGKLVAMTDESNAATHATANDSWADVVPSDNDAEVRGELASAVIADVLPKSDPTMVIVARQAD